MSHSNQTKEIERLQSVAMDGVVAVSAPVVPNEDQIASRSLPT